MKKDNIGSSFDSWLREEGIYQEVTAPAIKRVLARQDGTTSILTPPLASRPTSAASPPSPARSKLRSRR